LFCLPPHMIRSFRWQPSCQQDPPPAALHMTTFRTIYPVTFFRSTPLSSCRLPLELPGVRGFDPSDSDDDELCTDDGPIAYWSQFPKGWPLKCVITQQTTGLSIARLQVRTTCPSWSKYRMK
jgi:hypothetical protein